MKARGAGALGGGAPGAGGRRGGPRTSWEEAPRSRRRKKSKEARSSRGARDRPGSRGGEEMGQRLFCDSSPAGPPSPGGRFGASGARWHVLPPPCASGRDRNLGDDEWWVRALEAEANRYFERGAAEAGDRATAEGASVPCVPTGVQSGGGGGGHGPRSRGASHEGSHRGGGLGAQSREGRWSRGRRACSPAHSCDTGRPRSPRRHRREDGRGQEGCKEKGKQGEEGQEEGEERGVQKEKEKEQSELRRVDRGGSEARRDASQAGQPEEAAASVWRNGTRSKGSHQESSGPARQAPPSSQERKELPERYRERWQDQHQRGRREERRDAVRAGLKSPQGRGDVSRGSGFSSHGADEEQPPSGGWVRGPTKRSLPRCGSLPAATSATTGKWTDSSGAPDFVTLLGLAAERQGVISGRHHGSADKEYRAEPHREPLVNRPTVGGVTTRLRHFDGGPRGGGCAKGDLRRVQGAVVCVDARGKRHFKRRQRPRQRSWRWKGQVWPAWRRRQERCQRWRKGRAPKEEGVKETSPGREGGSRQKSTSGAQAPEPIGAKLFGDGSYEGGVDPASRSCLAPGTGVQHRDGPTSHYELRPPTLHAALAKSGECGRNMWACFTL